METHAFKIQISPSLYQQLGLTKTTYVNKQEAIKVLKRVLNEQGILFKIQEKENRTAFVNKADGELIAIVPC